METAIYCIKNLKNGKIYIGSTKSIEKRWYRHRYLLKKGKHPNKHLQYAWDFYGETLFEFTVLEKNINIDDLAKIELEYIVKLDSNNREIGYNIALDTIAPMTGRKHTEESIEKMRNAKIGEKNNFFGKSHSQETKDKISKKKKGKTITEEHKRKICKNLHSGELNINSKMKVEDVREIKRMIRDGEIKRGSARKLAKIYNVHASTILSIIRGKTWKEENCNENTEK